MKVNEVVPEAICWCATRGHVLDAHIAQATSRRLLALLLQELEPCYSILVLKASYDRLVLNSIEHAAKIGLKYVILLTDVGDDLGDIAVGKEFTRVS